jgi:hypothetical protein
MSNNSTQRRVLIPEIKEEKDPNAANIGGQWYWLNKGELGKELALLVFGQFGGGPGKGKLDGIDMTKYEGLKMSEEEEANAM